MFPKKKHTGRDLGPLIYELARFETHDIEMVGYWATNLFKKVYSNKLPIKQLLLLLEF